jgi:hypothetical protein
MIDKLLLRIARRSPSVAHLQPISILAAGSHGSSLPHSSSGQQDPFSTGFPAPSRFRSAHASLSVPGADNAWQMASDAYINARSCGAPIPDQPAFFAHWKPAHMAVAQLLWAEHENLHLGQVQIHSGDQLLAVMTPARSKVALRVQAYEIQAPLALRQMPAHTNSEPNLPDASKGFEHCSLHSLLWFYGQVYSAAPDLLPPEMGTHLIQLRRFPAVEPAALEMRHLALIHIFSGGALSFMQLQQHVAQAHRPCLCADVASLYFTGALRLLPR